MNVRTAAAVLVAITTWGYAVRAAEIGPLDMPAPVQGFKVSAQAWLERSPLSTASRNDLRDRVLPWRERQLHQQQAGAQMRMGLTLKPVAAPASRLKQMLRAEVSAQTYVVLKPRRNRVAVELQTQW